MAILQAREFPVFGLVIAVEIFSNWVHPLPLESEHSMEIMCGHVAAYPHWVLAAVVPMWGATAFAGAWVAGSIGRWIASTIVAALVLALWLSTCRCCPTRFGSKA